MPDVKTITQSKNKRILDDQVHRLSAALEAANVGVFEFYPQTGIANWDLRVGKIWGIPDDEEITYETVIAGVHPEDVALHDDMTAKALDPNGNGVMDMYFRVIPRNGEPIRWVRTVATCSFEDNTAVLLLGTVRDVTEKRKLEEHNQLLINELQHRVKNTLATVLSVIRLSKPEDNNIENYITSLEDRLLSMSNTHSLVNRNEGKSIDIKSIIEKEFLAYVGPKKELYSIKGPSLFIRPPYVQVISMAIHELITNACKHGALSMPDRNVTITTSLKDGIATFMWAEKGDLGNLPQGQPKGGFGSFLLSKIVSAEVQGHTTYAITPAGLFYKLVFPLEEARK